jgi:hypothetical protein
VQIGTYIIQIEVNSTVMKKQKIPKCEQLVELEIHSLHKYLETRDNGLISIHVMFTSSTAGIKSASVSVKHG